MNDGTGRFSIRQLLAVGTRSVGVSMGDVDNDGDLDLVSVSQGYDYGSGVLSICFNNGNGTFTRIRQIATGSNPQRVVLGDLDGDGDLDLITNDGSIRFNDGTGAFPNVQTIDLGYSFVLGDIDADGDLDLVVTKRSKTEVRLNNGKGQFSTGTPLSFTNAIGYLTLSDVDGDGDLDLLGNAQDNPLQFIHLFLNQRIAPPNITSFTPMLGLVGSTVVISGTDLIGTTQVTFNGTPAPDFTVNSANQITVKVPAGATTGLLSVTNPKGTATSSQPFTVLQPVSVVSVSPTRNATVPLTTPIAVSFSQAIATNTAANLAVFSQQRGGQLVGTRTGAGTNTLKLTPTQAFQPGERLSVSIPAYTEANQTRVVKQVYQFRAAVGGAGRGFFGAPQTQTLSQPPGGVITLGDIDNDGDQDMLTAFYASVEVRRNNGAGSFSSSVSALAVDTNPSGLALGDLDGDGDLDFVTSSSTKNVLNVCLNNGTGNFTRITDVAVGENPYGVSLADMDGDGDLDAVTVNIGSTKNTTSVRFNDGTGHFSSTPDEYIDNVTNSRHSGAEIGDVDGDGDLDVLINIAGTVHIRHNNGAGLLPASIATSFVFPYSGIDIHLSDTDADGDLDLLGIGSPSIVDEPSTVSVCRNDGKGNFTITSFQAAIGANGMAVHDIDADGDEDIIVLGTWDTERSQLWLNNGKGVFSKLLDIPLGTYASQLILSDVDNDGDLDLLNTNRDASKITFSVRLNGPPPPPLISGFSPTSGPEGATVVVNGSGFLTTTAIHFNGVSATNFVVNSPTQLTVKVPVGATSGTITVTSFVAVATSSTKFTVMPLVGFTKLTPGRNAEAASRTEPVRLTFPSPITAASASNMRVFGNQLRGRRAGALAGTGTTTLSFAPAQDFAPGERISISLPATMLTTDGGQVRPQVYQFRAATGGTGDGHFQSGTDVSIGQFALAMAMGDLDNDGDLDILTSTETGYTFNIGVMLNDGQARFKAGTSIDPKLYSSLSHIEVADVDGDGDLDVVASYNGSSISVCLNNGNATFAYAQRFSVDCTEFTLGDLDTDGDLDLVGSSYLGGLMRVALNDGTGRFTSQTATLVSPTVTAMTLGDVDDDGDLDVLTSNDANGLRLFLNDGVGGLTPGSSLSVPGSVRSAALGDIDSDGDLDIVAGYTASSYPSSLTTLVNDGAGHFRNTNQRVAAGNYINQVQLGDVDHDADLDIITVNGSSNNASIRLNDGAGNFSGTQDLPVHGNPTDLALGDLDNDGDLDFVATQATSGSTFIDVRLNTAQVLGTTPKLLGAEQVMLYPNPAHNQFVVVVPHELRPASTQPSNPLRLYNSVGQLVLEQPLRFSARGELTIGVAHLPAGIYTLYLPLGSSLATYKVVIL